MLSSRVEVMADEVDKEFIRRLKRRDENAFNIFVRDHQLQVFRIIYRMLGNQAEAEEIAQEVFITVFKAIENFREESRLSTWLYRIAVNHAKNRIKYLARRAHGNKRTFDEFADRDAVESATMQTSSPLPRPDEMAQAREAESILQNALYQLDSEFRELVVLRDIENMSYRDIGEITGLAEGTVKSRLHRARLALREQAMKERKRRRAK